MDLVDIDQVLDNLELHEEEAVNEQQKKLLEEKKQQQINEAHQKTSSTTNGFASQTKDVPGFKAVSQVFNSLDDYCKNVESLDKNVTSVSSFDEHFIITQSDGRGNCGFHPTMLVATRRQELEEYEDEVEGSKDIQKFTEKPRNKNKLTAALGLDQDSPDDQANTQSSESLTTSSNSTFSSGPSLEVDDSLEEPTPLSNSRENVMIEEHLQEPLTNMVNNKGILNEQLETTSEASSNKVENKNEETNYFLEDSTNNIKSKDEETEYLGELSNSLDLIQVNVASITNVEDLTQGLSSISLTSGNLQSQSILPLETSLSSSMGQVLKNLTDSNISSEAMSQTTDVIAAANNTSKDESSEAVNTSVEILNEQSVPDNHHQQLQEQQIPQLFDYNQVKYEECNSVIQQPVTFCSTMDEISDAELDSMLQEMDIDEEDVLDQPPSTMEEFKEKLGESLRNTGPETVLPTESVDKNFVDQSDELVNGSESSGDHPNGDSFSQASTVEFSEMRPQNQDLPECDDNMIVNSAVSSYSNSESSSLEGDIIHPKLFDKEDTDPSRRQRPTSLDLPAIQSDIYANAGQTPPGTEQPEHQVQTEDLPPSPDVEPEASPVASEVGEAAGYSEDPHANLGKIPPIWVPDNMATGYIYHYLPQL